MYIVLLQFKYQQFYYFIIAKKRENIFKHYLIFKKTY